MRRLGVEKAAETLGILRFCGARDTRGESLTARPSTVRVSASRTSGEDILQRRVGRRLGWLGVSAMAAVGLCATAPAGAEGTGPAPKAPAGCERRPQPPPQEELGEADSILTRSDQAAAA